MVLVEPMQRMPAASLSGNWRHSMKLLVTVATLFLATNTALPAFAAMPGSHSQRDAAPTPIEAVQYRQTPRQRADRSQARYRSGYNAYASHNSAPTSGTDLNRDVIPGWHCVSRGDSSTYSAYPAWEICN
jgi:hypothetical protein